MGFVVATNVNSREVLWKQRIYSIYYIPFLERDVQNTYISSLSAEGDNLIITNEKGSKFLLNLASRAVTKIKASS